MATDAIKAIGTLNINGFDLCVKSWKAKESGNKVNTSSSCDGEGQSSVVMEKMLTITAEFFYSKSRAHHSPSAHNIRVDATVDVEAVIGPTSHNLEYTMTDGKVIEWEVTSNKGDVVMGSVSLESQGEAYTVPTAVAA